MTSKIGFHLFFNIFLFLFHPQSIMTSTKEYYETKLYFSHTNMYIHTKRIFSIGLFKASAHCFKPAQ